MHISITPETVGHAFGLSITNTLLTSWLVVILLVALSIIISRKIKTVPGTLQNLAEWVIEKLLDFNTKSSSWLNSPPAFAFSIILSGRKDSSIAERLNILIKKHK